MPYFREDPHSRLLIKTIKDNSIYCLDNNRHTTDVLAESKPQQIAVKPFLVFDCLQLPARETQDAGRRNNDMLMPPDPVSNAM